MHPQKALPETYQAGRIKRRRRTKAQIEQLDQQIIDVLKEDNPQSVRHVFYRMTNPRLPESVEKSDKGYNHVQHRCKELRRSGRLPYQWITDATRRGYFTHTFDSAADFVRAYAGLYRADLWRQAGQYVEVWTESRSIAGIIEKDCRDLAVSLYPCGGFASISLAHEAAATINDDADGRPVTIFYIGDYDPAGVLIDQSLEKELRLHVRPEIEFQFDRIGITEQQIADLDLPTKPRKAGDKRSLHVLETVEAEAMPAGIMRQLLREHVEALLPPHALHVARVAERSEQRGLLQMAETLEFLR